MCICDTKELKLSFFFYWNETYLKRRRIEFELYIREAI
jgi:hypothetical protein